MYIWNAEITQKLQITIKLPLKLTYSPEVMVRNSSNRFQDCLTVLNILIKKDNSIVSLSIIAKVINWLKILLKKSILLSAKPYLKDYQINNYKNGSVSLRIEGKFKINLKNQDCWNGYILSSWYWRQDQATILHWDRYLILWT